MTISGMSGWRWFAFALSGLVFTFALACSSGGGSSGGAGQAASGGQGAAAPPDQQGLKLRTTGEPNTIDPHLTKFSTSTTIEKSLFSTLFTFHPDTLKIIPDFAGGIPTPDKRGIAK